MPSLRKTAVHAHKKLLAFTRNDQNRGQRSHANWSWNDNSSLNVHLSQHGTYNCISMHPYETMFVTRAGMRGSPFCHSTEGFIASAMRASQAEVDPLRDICTTMPRAKRFTGRSACRTHLNPALVANSDFGCILTELLCLQTESQLCDVLSRSSYMC